VPKIMKISLNLLKLHIKYCRLFFSGHGVYIVRPVLKPRNESQLVLRPKGKLFHNLPISTTTPLHCLTLFSLSLY